MTAFRHLQIIIIEIRKESFSFKENCNHMRAIANCVIKIEDLLWLKFFFSIEFKTFILVANELNQLKETNEQFNLNIRKLTKEKQYFEEKYQSTVNIINLMANFSG